MKTPMASLLISYPRWMTPKGRAGQISVAGQASLFVYTNHGVWPEALSTLE